MTRPSVSDRIRVLHCLERVYSGGAEQVRLRLVEELDPVRFEHRVFCTEARGPVAEAFRARGVELVEFGAPDGVFDRARLTEAARRMRRWRPHIVHGAVYEGCTMAALAGHLAHVPVVVIEEVNDPVGRSWRGDLLFRALIGLADQTVAVSPTIYRYLTDRLRAPARKVTLINNGVARPKALAATEAARLRERHGVGPDELVVGSVGRVVDHQKRFSDFVRAIGCLRDLPVKGVVVGDGPDLGALRNLVQDLGLADRIVLTGFQSPPDPYYGLMDVFALASAEEAFGLVIAEAMRAGLPVVATRAGGIPDVVVEGETGLLVPSYEPETFAAALRQLLTDPVQRRVMGDAGRRRADRLFSAERYARDVGELYESLVGGRPLGETKRTT